MYEWQMYWWSVCIYLQTLLSCQLAEYRRGDIYKQTAFISYCCVLAGLHIMYVDAYQNTPHKHARELEDSELDLVADIWQVPSQLYIRELQQTDRISADIV